MDFQTIIIMRILRCSAQSPSSRPEESQPYELNGREKELALNTGLGVFHGAFGFGLQSGFPNHHHHRTFVML